MFDLLDGLGKAKKRKKKQNAFFSVPAPRTFAVAPPPAPVSSSQYVPSWQTTQVTPVPADASDPKWGRIGGVMLIKLPHITVPTVESLYVASTIGVQVPCKPGFYCDPFANYDARFANSILKPGVTAFDVMDAKTWRNRGYKPLTGSERLLTQSIQALSGLDAPQVTRWSATDKTVKFLAIGALPGAVLGYVLGGQTAKAAAVGAALGVFAIYGMTGYFVSRVGP